MDGPAGRPAGPGRGGGGGRSAGVDRRSPSGSGEQLAGSKPATVRAIDATFSAPKSVSLLWAFGTPEVAAAVSIAHVEAVQAALGFVEARAAVTRRQVNGVRRRAATSGWAAATFVHRTSREGDPQLHTHAVIPNLVRREDGAWVAHGRHRVVPLGQGGRLGLPGGAAPPPVRAAGGGLGAGPQRLPGDDRAQRGAAAGVLEADGPDRSPLGRHRWGAGGPQGRMQADEAASLATRARKDRSLTPEHVCGTAGTAKPRAVGLPIGDALLAAVDRPRVLRTPIGRAEVRALFDRLVDPEVGLCAHESRFGEAQVIEAVAAWGAGRLTVSDIETLSRAFLDSDRVVRLVNRDSSGRAPSQWSTVAHRRLEDRVLDHLAVLQQRQVGPLDQAAVTAAIAGAAAAGRRSSRGGAHCWPGPGPGCGR